MSKKRNDKESMICLTPKPSPPQKKFRNNLNFFMAFIKTRPYPLDYTIRGVFENKTNATSHRNIGSFKTAIEEEWNKMSEELILKASKSFRRYLDANIKKIQPY